jgi:hypothetical protein
VDDLSASQVRTLLNVADGAAACSDTAYAASWDGVTDVAPSKNAVYDKIELLAPKDDPAFTGIASVAGQPCFSAYFTATVTDVTGDGTVYSMTGASLWTELFDRAGNFSNGTFTAPVTGKYLLCGQVTYGGLTVGTHNVNVIITTSNRNYYVQTVAAAAATQFMPFSVIIDMDANDIVYLRAYVLSGTKVVDVGGGTNNPTIFTGYLLP